MIAALKTWHQKESTLLYIAYIYLPNPNHYLSNPNYEAFTLELNDVIGFTILVLTKLSDPSFGPRKYRKTRSRGCTNTHVYTLAVTLSDVFKQLYSICSSHHPSSSLSVPAVINEVVQRSRHIRDQSSQSIRQPAVSTRLTEQLRTYYRVCVCVCVCVCGSEQVKREERERQAESEEGGEERIRRWSMEVVLVNLTVGE